MTATPQSSRTGTTSRVIVDDGLPKKKPHFVHYAMLIPAIILFSIFITLPAIQGVVYSFTNYAGYGDSRWIGFANYQALFGDPAILEAYSFTFIFAIATTLFVNVLSLALAVLLNSKIKWSTLFKAIYFIPMVLSALVVAFCFQYIFSQALPRLVSFGPLHEGILSNPGYAWLGVVFVAVWTAFPGSVIMFLAGLSSIGPDVYEAGEIDGASPWDQFRQLTLPLLAPFLVINTVLGLKGFLGAYDIIVGLTNGGPGTATRSVAMTIVNTLNTSDYAYGAANSVVFAVVTILLSIAQLGLIRFMGKKS
ncbi:carbohydrate ABC transporter permease [Pararhizobium sp.]|uniref:carbohydrate ABC transporter permease n=1 Tax=Pararhizobium sp. TaxID=1977563 RepID=UPI002718F21E|nr:sugar ABC transporter permease [Pararhizobium sp.]MDO9417764.1 sugar ABC transporter permease [Pararhizobium sp.]